MAKKPKKQINLLGKSVPSDKLKKQENVIKQKLDSVYIPPKPLKIDPLQQIMKRKNFSAFLKAIKSKNYNQYDHFTYFINTIKKPEILSRNYSQIKSQFYSYLKHIDACHVESFRLHVFSELLTLAKEEGWIKEGFHQFLKSLERFDNNYRSKAYDTLFQVAKENALINELKMNSAENFRNYLKTLSDEDLRKYPYLIRYDSYKDLEKQEWEYLLEETLAFVFTLQCVF